MKKTILAASLAALFATSAQAATVYDADGVSADVYGRMQFDISNNSGDTDGDGSARMGFKAKSMITADLDAVAKGEWQIDAESDGSNGNESKFTARHVYAGISSAEYGEVVFGQTDTAFYQVVAPTDIFNTYGYEAFSFIEDGRQPGQIVYNGSFDGFYVGASYQFRDEDFTFEVGNPNNPTDVDFGSLDNAYALTLGYEFDFGLAIYAGYHLEEFENEDKHNYGFSAAYTIDNLYLAAVLSATDMDNNNLYGYDFVASYDLSDSLAGASVYTGYAMQDAEDDWEDFLGDDTPVQAFKLGAQYKLNSNAKTWIEYRHNADDAAKDADEEDQVTVAIQYNF